MRLEQLGELLDHRAGELLRVHDGHGAVVIAGHVMADADGDQFDRRTLLDPFDDLPQMPLEIGTAIGSPDYRRFFAKLLQNSRENLLQNVSDGNPLFQSRLYVQILAKNC